MTLHSGKKHKTVWELLDVQGRKDILIHGGIKVSQTEGCILVTSGTSEILIYTLTIKTIDELIKNETFEAEINITSADSILNAIGDFICEILFGEKE